MLELKTINLFKITPPWIEYPNFPPNDMFWRQSGEYYLSYVWEPFWNNLSNQEREIVLKRWPMPQEWIDHADLIKFLDEIDQQSSLQSYKKIMIFGRPGSGKSTFASWLANNLNLPLHHLDKHFFTANWVERDYNESLNIQQNIVNNDAWVVDGNSIHSLEMRFHRADLALYFNFPRIICYSRILKRFFRPNTGLDDRASGCRETINPSLFKYMWSFEKRVRTQILLLKDKYPSVVFREIKNKNDLNKLKHELTGQCWNSSI